jgi:hypothetical protein
MDKFKTVDRKRFLTELSDVFIDSKLFGYECVGVSHTIHSDVLILDLQKSDGTDDIAIKLDLSNIGIEFGTNSFEDDDDGVFTSKLKIEG